MLALPAFVFISFFFFTPSNGEGASLTWRSASGESLTVPLDCTGRVGSERIRGLSGLGVERWAKHRLTLVNLVKTGLRRLKTLEIQKIPPFLFLIIE